MIRSCFSGDHGKFSVGTTRRCRPRAGAEGRRRILRPERSVGAHQFGPVSSLDSVPDRADVAPSVRVSVRVGSIVGPILRGGRPLLNREPGSQERRGVSRRGPQPGPGTRLKPGLASTRAGDGSHPLCAESRTPRARFRRSASARVSVAGAPAPDDGEASGPPVARRPLRRGDAGTPRLQVQRLGPRPERARAPGR
jgi:hypothetical protein